MGKINASNKLIGASGKEYVEDENFVKWVGLVTDKNNKKMFGNETQAAIEVYGYDPTDRTQYRSAVQHGWRNYAKFRDAARLYYNEKGVTFGLILDTILARMATSLNPVWIMLVADIMGMRDIRNKVKRAADGSGGDALPPQMTQYNFFNNNEQRRNILKQSGVDKLNTGELIDILIKGRTAERQGDSMGVHNGELSGTDSEDSDM